jgi:DNA-directed RNA polymerase omega subunit
MNSKDLNGSRGIQIDPDKCLEQIGIDRFSMVLVAAARAREIKRKNTHSNRREHIFPTVTALLEIQEGKIGKEYIKKI